MIRGSEKTCINATSRLYMQAGVYVGHLCTLDAGQQRFEVSSQ